MKASMEITTAQTMQLEQTVECTLVLKQELEDPLETARRLFHSSKKVNVSVEIGAHRITVTAALVSKEDLANLFENEEFAGLISGGGERFQFFRKGITAPKKIVGLLPQLMAFHCLAAIRVNSFGDPSGTLKQYQAIALEMAYAKNLLADKEYEVYESWRQSIERTDFFKRPDWREIVARTSKQFGELIEETCRKATAASFTISKKGEPLRLKGKVAVDTSGKEIPVYKKRRLR